MAKDDLARDLEKVTGEKKHAEQELGNLRQTMKTVQDSSKSDVDAAVKAMQAKLDVSVIGQIKCF